MEKLLGQPYPRLQEVKEAAKAKRLQMTRAFLKFFFITGNFIEFAKLCSIESINLVFKYTTN